MKNLLFFCSFFFALSLASCSKEYTCTCTTTDSSGVLEDQTTGSTFTTNKGDAETACAALEITVGTLSTTCVLE